jgi:circadian clock protein KaiC
MVRNRTGIPELDEMLRGGFMDKDAVMVAGSAGTGKTTLALEYLVNGAAQFSEPGIYLTFEQLPDQIYRDAESFGWNLRKLEEENKLRVVCTSPDLLLESDGGEQLLGEIIQEIQPKRMVIDSLNHLEMYVPRGDLRKEAYRILMYIKTRGISPLVVWEAQQGVDSSYMVTQTGMSFLIDCLVLLKFVEIDSSMKKAVVIMKMRGSDHDKRLREYEITAHGLRVAAPFSGYEGIITGSPHRSLTQEVAGAWDNAFTRTKHKQ